MAEESLRKKSAKAVFWSFLEKFSVTGIQFLVQIILARLLTPDDYGIIGLLTVFLSISYIFIDSGFSTALIRNQNRTEKDFATAFFFNVFVAILFYALLFIAAPFIANFYKMPELIPVARVLGLVFVITSLGSVQNTHLSIAVDFKTKMKASFLGVVISGGIGIFLAYHGFGVWALVTQTLVSAGVNVVCLWIFVRWHPKCFFSWNSFKPLFSFGSRLLLSSILNSIYQNIYPLVIGKAFSAKEIGFFTKAVQLSGFPSQTAGGVLNRVTFPLLATIQDDEKRMYSVYLKYIRLAAEVLMPLMIGLAVIASPLIGIVLGEKWMPIVPLFQILCFGWMFDPIDFVNLNLLYVKGRSDLVLKLEIIKKIVAISILFISLPYGLVALCIGKLVYGQFALIMNTYYTGKFLGLSYWRQWREILPVLALSCIMGIVVYFSTFAVEFGVFKLIIGILVGIVFYFALAVLLKFEIYKEVKNALKGNK